MKKSRNYEQEKKEKAIGILNKLMELIDSGTYKVNLADFWTMGLDGRLRFMFDVTDVSVFENSESSENIVSV